MSVSPSFASDPQTSKAVQPRETPPDESHLTCCHLSLRLGASAQPKAAGSALTTAITSIQWEYRSKM